MFSYEEYRKIIKIMQKSGKYTTFHEAKEKDEFILMRHDVEFSVDRAYELAQVEKSMDFTSAYFFQWTNNSYNILSKKNTDMIREMHEEGHTIGLHFAVNGLTDIEEIKEKIMLEMKVLSSMMGFDIETFSVHRPSKEILRANIKLNGIINAYEDHFFTFAEAIDDNTALEVKYLSDAMHKWNYGIPDEETLLGNKKVQVLTHPYSWTEQGHDNLNNFKTLIEERNYELLETINGECKHFADIRPML
ncbi:MAG: hypothetical protein PHT21_09870 [Lachnospiraceae bacterium]|nr:hypothetical protein [Lachnospiraceae bacterium]